jgi:hypothetical protein
MNIQRTYHGVNSISAPEAEIGIGVLNNNFYPPRPDHCARAEAILVMPDHISALAIGEAKVPVLCLARI